MAFIEKRKEDEEQQAGATPFPELATGGPDIGAGTQAAQLQSPETAGKGGFTDINAYLDANRAQAGQMGDLVAGRVTEQGNAARTGVDTAFNTASANIVPQTNTTLIDQAIADPNAFSQNQGNIDAFRQQRASEYTGPGRFQIDGEQESELFNNLMNVGERARGINNREGIRDFLYASGDNPTLGGVELDNLLLQQDPTARERIESAARPFQNIEDYLEEAANRTGGELGTRAEANRANAGRLQTSSDQFVQGLQNAFNANSGNYNQEMSDARRILALFGFGSGGGVYNPGNGQFGTGTPFSLQDANLPGIGGAQGIDNFNSPLSQAVRGIAPNAQEGTELRSFLQERGFNVPGREPVAYGQWGQTQPWVDFVRNFFPQLNLGNQATQTNTTSASDAARLRALESIIGSSSGYLNPNETAGSFQRSNVGNYGIDLQPPNPSSFPGGANSNAYRSALNQYYSQYSVPH